MIQLLLSKQPKSGLMILWAMKMKSDEAEWIDLILLMKQFYINKVEGKKNAGNNRKH
jgi:hypothetical protein